MSISDRHVPHVLQNYSAVTGPVCLILPVTRGGFSGAQIWKVESKHGIFALRRWPAHGPDSDRLKQLHQLLEGIACDEKCPVARPCPDRSGETLVFSDRARWQLEPWLPGRALQPDEYGIREVQAACGTLAVWHNAAVSALEGINPSNSRACSAENLSTSWFRLANAIPPCIAERIELARDWEPHRIEGAVMEWRATATRHRFAGALETELPTSRISQITECLLDHCRLARESHASILAELNRFAGESRQLQPCLRDVWSDHVLFREGSVSGIIDPAAARTDSVTTDLARLLGSVAMDSRERWEAGLAKYAQLRDLSTSDCMLIRVLDRSAVLLSPVIWLRRLQNGRVRPDQAQDVVVRLQSLVERHRNMVASTGW